MDLKDKILYCRKRSGLSQDALAERIDVSRQAVSKWETGEATPEVGKLLLLANAFGVSTDWLLSDAEPEETAEPRAAEPQTGPTWLDAVPGMIGRLLRRYGWLFGVYLAVAGAGFAGIGALARSMVRRMFTDPFGGGAVFEEQLGGMFSATGNPVFVMGSVIMTIGAVMIIGGVVLAIVLKKRGGQGDNE